MRNMELDESSKEFEEARKKFAIEHPALTDDKNTPEFYQQIINDYCLPRENIVFIVVAHCVHTLPYFLEGLSKLGRIAAVIPKGSPVVSIVKKDIFKIYEKIIRKDINKEILRKDPYKAEKFLNSVILNDEWKGYKFIIIDHGGYFAPVINKILVNYKNNIIGIIEHTLNGIIRYEGQEQPFKIPVHSIARSNLKSLEDREVAKSIVDAIHSDVFSGKGLNQYVGRVDKIALLGYGHMGRNITKILFNTFHEKEKSPAYYICDINKEKKYQVEMDIPGLAKATIKKSKAIKDADVIILATSKIALTQKDFNDDENIKNNACIICVTSSDDLITSDALDYFEKISNTGDKLESPITRYRKKGSTKEIFLAADGGSVNYLQGSTAHPIIHAIFASVLVSVSQMVNLFYKEKPQYSYNISVGNIKDDEKILQSWKKFYGDIQTLTNADEISMNLQRTELRLQNKIKELLFKQLSNKCKLGKAVENEDSFFDALAIALNRFNSTNVNSIKFLRLLCFEFYRTNRELVDEWTKSDNARMDENWKLQYTAEECIAVSPLRGRPSVEGKILCRMLDLEGIIVIELFKDLKTKKSVLNYNMITKNGYKKITGPLYPFYLSQEYLRLPCVILDRNNMHFVPLKCNITNVVNYQIKVSKLSNELAFSKLVNKYETDALRGNEDAHIILGSCYEHCYLRYEHNDVLAFRHYQFIAYHGSRGDSDYLYVLGNMYLEGKGIEQDYKQAAYHYDRAADLDHVDAQYALGYCYAYGLGINQDSFKAVSFFRQARERGNQNAKDMIEEYCKSRPVWPKQQVAGCKSLFWIKNPQTKEKIINEINTIEMKNAKRCI